MGGVQTTKLAGNKTPPIFVANAEEVVGVFFMISRSHSLAPIDTG